jgi:hypothetical protein
MLSILLSALAVLVALLGGAALERRPSFVSPAADLIRGVPGRPAAAIGDLRSQGRQAP